MFYNLYDFEFPAISLQRASNLKAKEKGLRHSPFQMFSDFLKSQGIFPLPKTHWRQDLSFYLLKISFLKTTLRVPIIIFEKWKHGYPSDCSGTQPTTT